MKKKDLILAAGILLLAVLLWLTYKYVLPQSPHASLRITVAGEEYGTYPLETDREIPIGHTNVCVIRNGQVTMMEASCPDHLCMKQKAIDSRGGTIVCLPNRVVLDIMTQEEEGMDAVTGIVLPGR